MTVTRMRNEMPNAEYVAWGVVLGRRGQRRQIADQQQAVRQRRARRAGR